MDKPSTVVNKIPELASLSSISAATPMPITSSNAVIPIQCSEIFKQMTSHTNAEKEKNKKSIEDFVKAQLFKRLKFYNTELMMYSSKKSSICQKVCNHLNMAEAGRLTFWNTYSPCVESAIRVGRIDAVQAMKRSFLEGKLTKQYKLKLLW